MQSTNQVSKKVILKTTGGGGRKGGEERLNSNVQIHEKIKRVGKKKLGEKKIKKILPAVP